MPDRDRNAIERMFHRPKDVRRITTRERRNREPLQADEIVRRASAHFAAAELDHPFRQ